MKKFWILSTKIISFSTTSILLTSCEASRPKRLYESGKSAYEDYEKTGDATWLIVFIVLVVFVGVLWLWSKSNKK